MGSSHYKSHIRKDTSESKVDIVGFDSIGSINKITATTVIIRSVASAPTVHGTTNVIAGTKLQTGNYIKIGTKYILTTAFSTAASINAAATALLGTCPKGSIALGAGEFWIFSSDNSATMYAQP